MRTDWHVALDDFEVSIFLTETDTRHSLLFKHKHFHDTTQTKLTSNSSKLTGASREAAIDIDDQAQAASEATAVLREEDDDDDVVALRDIPAIDEDESPAATRPSKRRRARPGSLLGDDDDGGSPDKAEVPDSDGENDGLFVSDEESDGSAGAPPAKRRKDATGAEHDEDQRDDKKKLAMDISYEGFSIYGRVLCLVVKKREGGAAAGRNLAGKNSRNKSRHAMMENWITSTQIPEAVSDETLDAA